MLNVLRLTTGVLKKLQLSDLAKLLLISSSTSTSTMNSQSIESAKIIIERASVTHHHHHHNHKNDSNDCCIFAEQQNSYHQNDNTTTVSSTTSSISSSATFSSVISSTDGINLKSTKSQFKESVDDSIKSNTFQASKKVEESSCKIAVMSSTNSTVNNNVNNFHCDGDTSSSNLPSSSSSSEGSEGSKMSSCSNHEKSCFTSSLADILKFLELVGNLKVNVNEFIDF